MSRLSKLSFLFSGISFICLILGRLALGGWHHFLWVPLLFFLVLFILPLVREGRHFLDFFRMKTTKKGLSMGTLILLVLTGLVLVNIIGVRKYKTWDFSAAQLNTLSDQSIQLLKNLDSELKATFFYRDGAEENQENRTAFRELIKKYQDQSDLVRLDFVEVNQRPDLASEYGVDRGTGIVFLEYKGRRNRIEKIDEQEMTTALVKVSRAEDKILYFVSGHGERDVQDAQDPVGLNSLKLLLENNRYQVKPLALSLTPKVPADADVVLIVGPQQNMTSQAVDALRAYLRTGGRILLALEQSRDSALAELLGQVGIQAEGNYVLNVVDTPMGRGVQQGATIASNFSLEHEITRVFGRNEFVLFRLPTALKRTSVPEGVVLTDIVRAQDGSMAFRDLTFSNEGPTGSFPLGMVASGVFPGGEAGKEFQLVVFGDADFLSNAMLYQNLNRDLVLNSIASLAQETDLISITPKEPSITQMNLPPATASMFVWGFCVPLPLLILAVSIGLWVRRRFA